MFMKKTISILLTAGIAMSMFGCGSKDINNKTEDNTSSEEKTITLGYWGDSGETNAYNKAIEGIENEVPGVNIKLQHYPSTADFWNSLPGQIAAGTAPDIIAPTNEQHLSYIDSGLFLPLSEYNLDMSNFSKNAIDSWSYDGKLYGIPITASPAIFVINKDLWNDAGLGEYPKTWEEVAEAAKALTKDDNYGMCIDLSQGYHVTQYLKSFGGGWENGSNIGSKENNDAFNYIFNMYKDGYAVNPKDLGLGWDGEVFAAGKAAMTTAGTWYLGFLKGAAPDLNYDIIPMPSGNNSQGSTLHSVAYTVLKSADDPETAAKVAYYLAREEGQKAYAEIVGGKPSLESLNEFYYDLNPQMLPIKDYAQYATDFGYPIESAKFQDALVKSMEEIIYTNNKDFDENTIKSMLDNLSSQFSK